MRPVPLSRYLWTLSSHWAGRDVLVHPGWVPPLLFHLKTKTSLARRLDDPGHHSVLDEFPGAHIRAQAGARDRGTA